MRKRRNANYISGVRLSSPVAEDSYLAALPVVKHLRDQGELSFSKAVTFLVGENGAGKSTLLEGIAVAYGFNAEGGSRNYNFSTFDSHADLYKYLTLVKSAYPKDGFFMRAESFYNAASYNDGLEGGRLKLHQQSHGESFLALVQNRFGGEGLYLLDEPESALSPSRLLILLAEIHRLAECRSQLLIATHSPILMACPGAEIYELTEEGIRSVDYSQTEHYQITRSFLENPERMLRHLLEE